VNAEGARLIYTHTIVNQNVWMVDTVNPTAAATRMIASTGGEWAPRLSPDGKNMVFTSDRSGSIQVWTADAEGRDQRQLTHIEGSNKSAARFSPNGQKIVFISTRGGESDIFTMDIDGTKPKRIAHGSARDTAPSWSADGRWIYFASDRDGQFEVWKVPVSGGDAVQLTKNGGYAALASPEGKYIYYTKQTSPPGLWRAELDGATETLVIPEIDQWGNFAVTKKGVYYISPEEKDLRFYDFAKKATASVWKTDKPLDSGMSASGDGKHILVGQTDRSAGELMLVENFH
jgi:Tol biopolymer transport system component